MGRSRSTNPHPPSKTRRFPTARKTLPTTMPYKADTRPNPEMDPDESATDEPVRKNSLGAKAPRKRIPIITPDPSQSASDADKDFRLTDEDASDSDESEEPLKHATSWYARPSEKRVYSAEDSAGSRYK